MTKGTGEKPSSTSATTQPGGRVPAETPQRLVVRSLDSSGNDSLIGGSHDTAVAMAVDRSGERSESTRAADPSTSDRSDKSGSFAQPDIVGKLLAERYMVTRKVGQGGMGAVYEATHTLINK